MENLAYLGNASNLVLYLEYLHFSPSKSANNVTNFMGTAFLLALLGGFLSDALFTTYQIYLISAVVEFLVIFFFFFFTFYILHTFHLFLSPNSLSLSSFLFFPPPLLVMLFCFPFTCNFFFLNLVTPILPETR